MFDALSRKPDHLRRHRSSLIVSPLVLIGYILLVEVDPPACSTPRATAVAAPVAVAGARAEFLGVFLVYPTIATIIRSFQNRRGNAFVGLENYQWFFSQRTRSSRCGTTCCGSSSCRCWWSALGLLVAVLVDRVRYESTVKSVIFLPLAISFVAAAVIWRFMYDLDPNIGTLNAVVTAVGGDPIASARQSQPWNNLFLIIVGVWLLTGFAMVILSAGLKGISTELLEAARVDGANEVQVFRQDHLPAARCRPSPSSRRRSSSMR